MATKKIDFQFAICPIEKGGFNKPLKATFTEFPSFLTAKICQDVDTNQNLPSDMKCPQTQQQNQRLWSDGNIAFVAPARRSAPEVELFWLEGSTKAQPPTVRLFFFYIFPQGEQWKVLLCDDSFGNDFSLRTKLIWRNVHVSEILLKIHI